MKKSLTIAALIVGTMASANVLAENSQAYNVKVFNLDKEAVVTVMSNGQPVSNIPVHVTGPSINQTYTTSDTGTVFVRNNTNVSNSLKISIQEPNGQEFVTRRFIASEK